MAELVFADVSEFQQQVDWAAYAAGGYPAAVCRVSYGTGHVDLQADRNIEGMRAHLRCRGFYGYLVASQDPTAQAGVLVRVLLSHGGLQPGEWVAVDVEEGSGDQATQAQAWLAAVNQGLHASPSQDVEYSGLNFAATHLTWVAGVTRWVAAYQQTAPAVSFAMWQNTDARTFPGIAHPCDASVFEGTVDQLLALTNPPKPAPPPVPPAPIPLGDSVQAIPLHCTLDANGWTAVDVPVPTGITKDHVVNVRMDCASAHDPQSWKWCQGEPDFNQPTPGAVRVVFKGDPGQYFTGRLIVS